MPTDFSPLLPDGTILSQIAFGDLPRWEDQDFKQVFAAFLVSCRSILNAAIINDECAVRPARPVPDALYHVSKQALLLLPVNSPDDIRRFFETYFIAYRILPKSGYGFLTAYYEPEIEGSPVETDEFPVPLLGRPEGLVNIESGSLGGLDLVSAQQVDGVLKPLPERAAIEDGALNGEGLELVWLKDNVELFIMHVQGSGRVCFADGTLKRFAYAGRNGHPYTSIGKALVAEGHMALETMTLASLKDWLSANPSEAKRIMRLNKSYIFFAPADHIPAHLGPIGGSGVSLTPHYSIAIDRHIWPYGLPFFVETALPQLDGHLETVAHIMVGQDTGSAILGAARADYFMGSGAEAGDLAGLVRHSMNMTVLLPKATR